MAENKVSRAILEDRYSVLMHSRGKTVINPSKLQRRLDDVILRIIEGVSQNRNADPESEIHERLNRVVQETVLAETERRGVAL